MILFVSIQKLNIYSFSFLKVAKKNAFKKKLKSVFMITNAISAILNILNKT